MATIHTAWDHVSGNIFKTWLIMILFTLFVVGVIYILARAFGFDEYSGLGIVGFALIFTGLINLISYLYSDKIVLAASSAKPVNSNSTQQLGNFTAQQLYRIVENLGIAGGLPAPRVYVIDDTAPNAFATGRDPKHAVVVFTTGILQKLNKQELEGVAAHELSHIGNRDTLVMTITAVLVGTLALLSDWYLRSLWFSGDHDGDSRGNAIYLALGLLAALLAPLVATMIQLAVSRRRELLADASGVILTRHPSSLMSALRKISADREPLEVANRGTAHLYIVNPLKGQQAVGWFSGLFNTHPPLEQRIKALEQMEGKF